VQDSFAEIRVSDTGPGIPPEDLPRIFDRFYRVDQARSRAEGGAGLGLSISRWIAEAHGGSISAESTSGGATFIVRIPLGRSDLH
jgi:two-component system OmpR family sensor kinase